MYIVCCVMYRRQRQGSLEVDGDDVMDGTSPGALQQLNVNNKLYLGNAYFNSNIHVSGPGAMSANDDFVCFVIYWFRH